MLKNRITEPELFRSQLNNMINLDHALCKLARSIDWSDLHEKLKHLYDEDFGRPAKSVRLMVGLHYLKYMKKLSDEQLVETWIENPYWQYFCGEECKESYDRNETDPSAGWKKCFVNILEIVMLSR